ncbi:MAG: ATP-binding domain-containing protein [Deltaproteobacteria bacterium]|nr:ATP-binding domain-containing protein [Deltaproteobacteria bacterium]
MATMIPNDIDEFKTEGERRFYEFIQSAAKPDQKYTCWYTPDIKGREPDFVLFSDEIGLVIFEVKDWALGQIEEANPLTFTVMMGKVSRKLTNPLRQARQYFESLREKIKADGRLVSKDPLHYGKHKVPIDYGVVFPNINKYQYCRKQLDRVIETNRCFFWDDLQSSSDIRRDRSGRCFRKTLAQMFEPKFPFSLTGKEYHHLKQLLFPVVRINDSGRNTCAYADLSERCNVLDDSQEAIARKCTSGCHIVSGPSGSGKTLILAQKAAFLNQYKPEIKRILFLCYNITLVNYIKRMLAEKGVALGSEGVEVYHFFELCSEILGEEVQYEKESREYYELVVEETLAGLETNGMKYEAILVDEGQDFSQGMIDVVLNLLDDETSNLTIALDEGQNIYGRSLAWQKEGARLPARIEAVSRVYRNTVEIRRFAERLKETITGKQEESGTTYCDVHGPMPELKRFKSYGEIADFAADLIKTLSEQGEYPLSEMAILYARKSLKESGNLLIPRIFAEALESKGIMSCWISQDYRAKRAYDITTETVSISTIHSAKGLDYGCVFLVGLDQLESGIWSEEQIRRLTYVAITRARHRLFIPYVEETKLVSDLISCLK